MISMISLVLTRAAMRRSFAAILTLSMAVFVMAGLALPRTAAAQGVYGSQVQHIAYHPNVSTVACTNPECDEDGAALEDKVRKVALVPEMGAEK